MKKLLKNAVISVMSTCALNIMTVLTHSWGSQADIVAFIPHALHFICMLIRVTYGTFANDAGRLPRRLALNGSQVYERVSTLISGVLKDHSVTSKLCTRPSPSRRHKVCYSKEQVLQVTDLAIPCIRGVMKGGVPELVDASLIGISSLLVRVINSAIVTYVGK